MRITRVDLSWFRGAGSLASLETKGKSIVVYGSNGSGKSSFADALEYVISNGKISHLSHEYSGPKQFKGIRNTHTPERVNSLLKITCENNRLVEGEITPEGNLSIRFDPPDTSEIFQSYDLERFILRQDEVANFIHATKGQKYSVLLPLLGLERIEYAAENLKTLKLALEECSGIKQKKQKLNDYKYEALKYLPDLSSETEIKTLTNLAKFFPEISNQINPYDLLVELQEAITTRINEAEPEQKQNFLFNQIANLDLQVKLKKLIEVEHQASEIVSEFLDHQIAVLQSVALFIENLDDDLTLVKCPACGRDIDKNEFNVHVQRELDSLTTICSARNDFISTRKDIVNSINHLLEIIKDPLLASWLKEPDQQEIYESLSQLSQIKLDDANMFPDSQTLTILQANIPIIHNRFSDAAKLIPPTSKDLMEANLTIQACKKIPEIQKLENEISLIDQIETKLDETETAVRVNIKDRTKKTIEKVSEKVQYLWKKLHPDEPIEEIQLYIPQDADKSIDICLKFFGVDQPSPRLSLSEGHRNSLGLCIFLALVILSIDNNDHPIVLDDVVSSMDREHRGMLARILLEDFNNRQVILLTHDREWYSELRARLPAKQWEFSTLKPWENPNLGIQWSQSKDTFDDAKALININAEAAGNRARAIMDTEMSIIAEKLYIQVIFARGDRNDRRTCIEFLERIISTAKNSFLKKKDGKWLGFQNPISDWENTHDLLVSWANRASHSGTLIAVEVEELIRACENAIAYFRCPNCKDPVWIADQTSRERLQCSCDELRWKYG